MPAGFSWLGLLHADDQGVSPCGHVILLHNPEACPCVVENNLSSTTLKQSIGTPVAGTVSSTPDVFNPSFTIVLLRGGWARRFANFSPFLGELRIAG
jgi:hypothetical protein